MSARDAVNAREQAKRPAPVVEPIVKKPKLAKVVEEPIREVIDEALV